MVKRAEEVEEEESGELFDDSIDLSADHPLSRDVGSWKGQRTEDRGPSSEFVLSLGTRVQFDSGKYFSIIAKWEHSTQKNTRQNNDIKEVIQEPKGSNHALCFVLCRIIPTPLYLHYVQH